MRKGTAYFPVSKLLTVKLIAPLCVGASSFRPTGKHCMATPLHSGLQGETVGLLGKEQNHDPSPSPTPFFGNLETHGMSNLSPGTASPHRGNYNSSPRKRVRFTTTTTESGRMGESPRLAPFFKWTAPGFPSPGVCWPTCLVFACSGMARLRLR